MPSRLGAQELVHRLFSIIMAKVIKAGSMEGLCHAGLRSRCIVYTGSLSPMTTPGAGAYCT